MILNITLGFVIPWIFGIILYFKDKKTLLVVAPFHGLISYTVNEFGYHFNFWRLIPVHIHDDYTSLSTNIGLYPILGSYLIYYIQKKKNNPLIYIFIFTFITTVMEYVGFLTGLVTYGNGWNVGWTFLSYLLPYTVAYLYYKKLRKLGVFR
ncbi:hypothetical protein CPJCM30710_21100 [Clostridium polyendosporum]|uniref:Uncharacterized protein n=1 Tax=Clostridium polyendosporum TaxID=69208 RepID=A0A919VER2_9CLOT|nr:CBO0543 family protein [Clostridium polyendosporum]GIM29444.1 hypothetical protein CPJCM30710_21100 [Clostridium polyendosporum]